eukprot:1300138-Prymnesium_polylepis.1
MTTCLVACASGCVCRCVWRGAGGTGRGASGGGGTRGVRVARAVVRVSERETEVGSVQPQLGSTIVTDDCACGREARRRR